MRLVQTMKYYFQENEQRRVRERRKGEERKGEIEWEERVRRERKGKREA
jgi:hypothetical protein